MDPFTQNVLGVELLVKDKTNKIGTGLNDNPEGVESEKYDAYKVDASDEDLLKMRDEYEKRYAPYESILKPRVDKIRNSYLGRKSNGQWLVDMDTTIASNLQFEAAETFLSASLAKNPESVVYCDNTPEGVAVAEAVQTMLKFHSDQLVLRRKLTLMVRQWSMDLLGVLKPGWNKKTNDVTIDNRKIRDYIFDPDGHVDAYGDFSSWFGERMSVDASELIEMFPDHREYINGLTEAKMGTKITYTEWWPNDTFCFYTCKEKVLDKHKNHLYNYAQEEGGMIKRNHFAYAKKPGIFLSVYSLQEHPHDITSNIEQNIPQQNRITRGTDQIDFNIAVSNNGYALSEANFNQETGKQAANARKVGNPILIPEGGPIEQAILPLAAQTIPNAFFEQVEKAKDDLRNSWGVQGLTSQNQPGDQTATEIIKDEQHDTSRIGGGVGDAIEQVADNAFNWLVQLYSVFYDDQHFAVIMGNAKAVEYSTLMASDMDRQVVVSVAPDSMRPKDELTKMNLAMSLFDKGTIGPKTLLKMVDFPDVDDAAADGVLWKINPQAYFQVNFPEQFAKMQEAMATMPVENTAQPSPSADKTAAPVQTL